MSLTQVIEQGAGGVGGGGGGGGNVDGPAVSTNTAIARWNGVTGKLLSNSGVLIDNSNNATGFNILTTSALQVNGFQDFGFPGVFSVGAVFGDPLNGYVSGANDTINTLIVPPGISDGVGDTEQASGIVIASGFAGSVLLGNQTANTTDLIGIDVEQTNYTRSSGVHTRTITGDVAAVRAGVPIAGAGVSFSRTPYAFLATHGTSNFGDGIEINQGFAAGPTLSFHGDLLTGLYRSQNGQGKLGFTSQGTESFEISFASNYSHLVFNNKFSLEDLNGTQYIDLDPSLNSGTFALKNFGAFKATTGLQFKRTATATDYTVLPTDYIIGVTNTSAPRIILLPVPSVGLVGTIYVVKDESGGAGTNNITLEVNGGGGLIDGVANYPINTNYGSASLYTNGVNWFTY